MVDVDKVALKSHTLASGRQVRGVYLLNATKLSARDSLPNAGARTNADRLARAVGLTTVGVRWPVGPISDKCRLRAWIGCEYVQR